MKTALFLFFLCKNIIENELQFRQGSVPLFLLHDTAALSNTRGGSQLIEKPLFRRIRPSIGGGARGGGSPPRVGSNALKALLGKAFSKRSEDFSAVERRESNGILF